MIKEVKPSRTNRYDGALKVTGQAMYTSDHHIEGMTFAVPVCAKIAKGKIKSIDSTFAKSLKGVIDVFTRETMGPVYRPATGAGMDYYVDEKRPPFEDDVISYYGQYVAVVVAETFEIAQQAARSVKVRYAEEKPNLEDHLEQDDQRKTDSDRGDSDKAFKNAEVKIDHTYVTPTEVHNTIELHATVAHWEAEDKLLIYETSQAVVSHQTVLSQILGIPRENIKVITKFLGSGFGGKAWLWPHSPIAAAVAKKINRPVKLVVDRFMEFYTVGHRPRTQQRIRLASDRKGHLQALMHEYAFQGSVYGEYRERCGEVSGFMYNVPNVRITSGIARRNQGVPTSMRGPGAVPGLFALESALDELSVELQMDPVALRILNDTDTDPETKRRFSSRHFRECLELGAKKFGWDKRNPKIGSMTDGDEILGWGVAACTWNAATLDAEAVFKFHANGRVSLATSAHDIGTGMYTVLAQIIFEETGVDRAKMDIEIGDTTLPKGPLSGGSMATASVIPAVTLAIRTAIKNLQTMGPQPTTSPMQGNEQDDKKTPPKKFDASKFPTVLKKLNVAYVEGRGSSKGTRMVQDKQKFTTKSFGAHFLEVGYNPKLARLRVRRVVTVIDAGRIMNYVPAVNQIEGAIIMGIGMGMLEEALYDKRNGKVVNDNLADYVVAVHADTPQMDVTFLDYPDKELNEYGARGLGEIGLAGLAAAITNGVYHATGIRVRELPVKIETLLKVK